MTVSPGHLIVGTSQSSIWFIFAVSIRLGISNGKTWSQTRLSSRAVRSVALKLNLLAAQFRWTDYVIHMDEHRIPKQIFYGQLTQGSQSCGVQFKRYKDTLKANLKSCGIPFAELESCTCGRTAWRTTCWVAIESFNLIAQISSRRGARNVYDNHTWPLLMAHIWHLLLYVWFKNQLVCTQQSSSLMRFVISTTKSIMCCMIFGDLTFGEIGEQWNISS